MKWITALPRLIRWTLWTGILFLVWMTLLRLGFYAYFNKQGTHFTDLLPVFWMGFRFDLRAVAILQLVMLALGSMPPLHPFRSERVYRIWMAFFRVLSLAFIFFYIVDFAHYAYLSQRLNASVLGYLEDTGISAEMVWQSYPVLRLVLLLIGLTLLLAALVSRGYRRAGRLVTPTLSRKQRVAGYTLVFLLLAFFTFGRFNQYPLRWSDAYSLGSDYKANLALNPFESFINTLKYRGKTYDEQTVKESFKGLAPLYGFEEGKAGALDYTRVIPDDTTRGGNPPNVILVICESFSAYKSSMWGNPLHTTPFFDSLSRQGIFFDHCFTPTYGTARGVWATLTGLPDVDLRQTSSRNPAAVDQHMILPQFEGYEKYYFIGGSPSWANIRGVLMNNIPGLHLYEEENLESPRLDVWGVSDKNLFLEATAILAKERKPFFAIIQTADNHRPYSIPVEDSDFVRREVPEDSLNRFGYKDQVSYENKLREFNAFRYTDYTFEKFMAAARKQPYFQNTLFVFVGDHGIAGDAGDMFPPAWTASRLTTIHVPLLFYAPAFLAPQRSSRICSQVDVMPTIAGICGIGYSNTTLGRDLLQPQAPEPFAFTFDPDNGKIGLIRGNHYYRRQLQNGAEEFSGITGTTVPVPLPDSLQEAMRRITQSIYHTAGYLLSHNKKRQPPR